MDWIVQNIFKLPPLLEGHRNEQLRISNVGLSFLRELALVVQKSGEYNEALSATDLAISCDHEGIEVPGCPPGADNSVMTRRIGSLLKPLFEESDRIEVEGFVVKRIETLAYDERRKENRSTKFCRFEPR